MRHKTPLMRRRIATEVIDFQDNSFGIAMEAIISKIVDNIRKIAYEDARVIETTDEIQELTKLIFKRTGIRLRFVTGLEEGRIIVFHTNVHGIFSKNPEALQFNNGKQSAILKESRGESGYVDLKNAKVGGLFSKYESYLYLNFYIAVARWKLTAPEITAIILHELGHIFHTHEYSDRLETTNQVLANITKELLTEKKEKNLNYVFRELQTIKKDITENEVDTILNGNRTIAGYYLFKTVVGSIRSQSSSALYDRTSSEQLADNFASRFGYGRPLISGLEKYSKECPLEKSKHYELFTSVLTMVTASMAVFFRLKAFAVFYPVLKRFLPVMVPVLIVVLFYDFAVHAGSALYQTLTSGETTKDYTYDDLKIRYQRIRNDYVGRLKQLDLPNDELKAVLKDIAFMDTIIKETHQYRTVYDLLANLIFSKDRQAVKAVKEEQLLEELANNDLFLQSAHFKTLA